MIQAPTIQELLDHAGDGPRVSLYMPTVQAGPEVRQNPIRFKNRLRDARTGLAAHGIDAAAIDALLAPAQARLDDDAFWQHRRDGLAMFLAPDFHREHRLARAPGDFTVVGARFHLKPLLADRAQSMPYNLLALSQNRVRLYAATANDLQRLRVDALPASLEDALGSELTDQHLDHHTTGARGPAMFHAQGRGKDDEEVDLEKFCRIVDDAVVDAVDRSTPLVLAGVEHVLAMYRSVSKHPGIVETTVTGNPDRLDDDELHAKAAACLRPALDARRERAIERFESARADDAAALELPEVVIAALDGRVDTLLFADDDERVPGAVDRARRELSTAGDESADDLVDRAVVEAYATGADLVTVQREQMPRRAHAVAITRY